MIPAIFKNQPNKSVGTRYAREAPAVGNAAKSNIT